PTASLCAWLFSTCSFLELWKSKGIPLSGRLRSTIAVPRIMLSPGRLQRGRIPDMLLIKNGRVLDPATKTDASLDILLDGEKIREVAPAGKFSSAQTAEVFDAAGLIVAPGFIDLHAHLREPGQESLDTIQAGTRAAAWGGLTAVCCMPTTKPVNDNASV